MFLFEKEFSRKLEEKAHELLHTMEEKKESILKELSGVDKITLAKLRELMDDYYNAENQLSEYVQKYKYDLTVAYGSISSEFERVKTDIEAEATKAEAAFSSYLSKIRADFEKQLKNHCESYLMEDYTREVINRIAEESEPYSVVQTTGNSTTQVMSQDAVTRELSQLSEKKVHKAKRAVNIFNGDFVNGYISGGNLIPVNNLYCTSRISVEAGEYLYYSKTSSFGGNSGKVFCYNRDGTYIGEKAAVLLDSTKDIYLVNIGANYDIRVNVGTEPYKNTFMLVKGNTLEDYPLEYEPYLEGEKFEEGIHLSKTNEKNVKVITNPLYGRKISVTGDSICYGNGYIGGYAKMIADNNNMTMQNIAVGGGTIVPQSGRFDISGSVASLDEDADYIIMEGGVNDSSLVIELGEFSRSFEQPTSRNTFYKALDYALYDLVHRFSGKKYGFVIVHQMSGKLCNINGDGATFYNAIIKCCEKWGVPVCDLNVSVPPFGLLPTTDPMRITYTTNNDGWHPTEECYRKYYVPKIEAWMKTL